MTTRKLIQKLLGAVNKRELIDPDTTLMVEAAMQLQQYQEAIEKWTHAMDSFSTEEHG